MDIAGVLKRKTAGLRHYTLVMAFAVVGIVLLVSVLFSQSFFQRAVVTSGVTNEGIATTSATFARSAPVRIQVPSINLDTTFVPPLGLNADKTVTVPDNYEQVGWYSGGATPGEVGPAVILGHVDSVSGPAVFYSLGQVKVGDKIVITRDDGSLATFAVTKLQRYPQSNFPTLDVYGPTDTSVLRLVTCTGTFNKGEQRYSHNLVVYAELIDAAAE